MWGRSYGGRYGGGDRFITLTAKDDDDNTKYEPSQPLRDHIRVRLEDQQNQLESLLSQTKNLIAAAQAGALASRLDADNKGPGDVQVSSQQAKMVTSPFMIVGPPIVAAASGSM